VIIKECLREFIADESGTTAIENGLIAAGIALAIITAVQGSAQSSAESLRRSTPR
jgi:Flp pilus assembly pilin Flp